ncbi:hypothetical protein [Clostridium sp. C8-1-8]|uniref:hypothetical protein n=1 Tax=Clostridium sp. C8-1-8 TaxID=2698831 RepID=UPI00136CB622|nr:hypothetical protein [Clostridium sp. C8-1-8]
MTGHIKKLIEDIFEVFDSEMLTTTKSGLLIHEIMPVVLEELNKLSLDKFPPEVRYDFLVANQYLCNYFRDYNLDSSKGYLKDKYAPFMKRMIDILDTYGYLYIPSRRDFKFIHNNDLRTIIERDYFELNTKLFPEGAWKSTVILAGSILEAILYDVLTNPIYVGQATASRKAPRNLSLFEGEWKLQNLIRVAGDIKLIPSDRVKSIDQVLRSYRNFVHPKVEIKIKYPCTEAEGLMAKGNLEAICNHLEEIFS